MHQRRVPGACDRIVWPGPSIGSQINTLREKGSLQRGRFFLELHAICQVSQDGLAQLRGKAGNAASQASKEFFLKEAFDSQIRRTYSLERIAGDFPSQAGFPPLQI